MEPAIIAAAALAFASYVARLLCAEMRRRDLAERAERNALLERIQRPDVPLEVVAPGEPVELAPAKLWRSEDDELNEAQSAFARIEELEHERDGQL